MALADGKCPLCGSEIRVPSNQEKTFCSSCGEEIMTEAAISYYQDPLIQSEDVDANRSNTADAPATPMTTGETVLATTNNVVTSTIENSFLGNWKTNVVGTIAGAVLLMLIDYKLSTSVSGVSYFLFCLIQIAAIIYALFFYNSLFKSNPLLKSNYSVSICNGFFGGPIFGPLWNSNLTKKNRGISHYVFATIGAVSLIALLVMAIPYLSSSSASTSTYSTGTVAQTPAASIDSKFVGTWISFAMRTNETQEFVPIEDLGVSAALVIKTDGSGDYSVTYQNDTVESTVYLKATGEKDTYAVYGADGTKTGELVWQNMDGEPYVLISNATTAIGFYKAA